MVSVSTRNCLEIECSHISFSEPSNFQGDTGKVPDKYVNKSRFSLITNEHLVGWNLYLSFCWLESWINVTIILLKHNLGILCGYPPISVYVWEHFYSFFLKRMLNSWFEWICSWHARRGGTKPQQKNAIVIKLKLLLFLWLLMPIRRFIQWPLEFLLAEFSVSWKVIFYFNCGSVRSPELQNICI